jgi:hypothetical protein
MVDSCWVLDLGVAADGRWRVSKISLCRPTSTLLSALHVFCDDHLVPPQRRHPARRKKPSDAELICLAVAQVLLDRPSQHRWLRFAYDRLGHLFPDLPHQPGHHKRLAAATPPLMSAAQMLARQVPSNEQRDGRRPRTHHQKKPSQATKGATTTETIP